MRTNVRSAAEGCGIASSAMFAAGRCVPGIVSSGTWASTLGCRRSPTKPRAVARTGLPWAAKRLQGQILPGSLGGRRSPARSFRRVDGGVFEQKLHVLEIDRLDEVGIE